MTLIAGDDSPASLQQLQQPTASDAPASPAAVSPASSGVDHPYSGARWSLVLPHRERLVHIARRRLPNAADAEDCANEALVRAAGFRNLDHHRVGQFLTTTVIRLCVDHHRARMRTERMMTRTFQAPFDPGPEDAVCDRAEADWLLAQAHRLRGRERQVILARAAGRSTRQAADDLAISVKAAEGAFTRGRARLLAACRA